MIVPEPFQSLWQAAGFTAPTAIQTAVAQPLAAGDSLIGLAPTGAGKTLAFGLPLLAALTPKAGVQLVIVAPSQELAVQIRDVLRPYAAAVDLTLVSVTGSANVKRQLEQLKRKPEVIVATAGRLLELIAAGKIKLNALRTLVIDEADEMLHEPGLSQVRELKQAAPAGVQLALFSATASPAFAEVGAWFGVSPQQIDVRDVDDTQGAVQHLFIQTDNAHRTGWLRHLAHLDHFQALVFFNQNATMMAVARTLAHQQVRFAVLAKSDRAAVRAKALTDFRKGRVTLLLVTDLAGRGLDIPRLPAVINYQPPLRDTAYIHRAGRTGRMGASGQVITLGNAHDLRDLKKLVPQYQIVRGYLVDGKLGTTPPVQDDSAESTGEKPVAQPTAGSPLPKKASVAQPVAAPAAKTAAALQPAKKRPHKKNRARDRKNKGKPRRREG